MRICDDERHGLHIAKVIQLDCILLRLEISNTPAQTQSDRCQVCQQILKSSGSYLLRAAANQ